MKPLLPLRLWCLAAAGTVAAQEVVNERAIELPAYTVTDTRDLPPPEKWSYGRIAGFEVLSNASPKATKKLVDDFQRYALALGLVWPGIQRPSAVPAALIICGRGGQFDTFLPRDERRPDRAMASLTLRGPDVSAIVIDYEARVINLATPEGLAAAAAVTTDADGNVTSGGGDPGFAVDAYRQLYREYIRFLIGRLEPRPAAWLEEGLAQLFMAMEVTNTSVLVGRVEDPNEVSALQGALNDAGNGGTAPVEDRDFNAALAKRALLPMAELFAVTNDSDRARHPLGSTWAKQCYAFVHWGLYGDMGKHQAAFVRFLQRLDREPLTEALFQDCFQQSYRDMALTLRGYVEFTAHTIAGVAANKGQKLPEPPAFELRDATEAEVGRIKGDVLRVAGHEAAAHRALIAPYIRGERDPQLLAALGLQERAAGDPGRARKFLEAAARAQAVRPRAYLALARMRFEEASAHPAAGEKFSAAQTTGILTALFAARSQPPPLVEVYQAIGEAWDRCVVTPGAAHLAVLDEGVRHFPRNAALVYQDAALKAKSGLGAEAAALADLGLRLAADGPTREKFEALKARLPPPAAPATAR
jgi:hypothetical protein